ncbi:GAF domain-containing protein [Bacteroidota bacterium]
MQASSDILVFLDLTKSTQMLESTLKIDQSTIQFADKGGEGINKFCNYDFDLVIYEISQDLISEIQFMEQLLGFNKNIPIVIVTEFFDELRSQDNLGINDQVFHERISDYLSVAPKLDKLSSPLMGAPEDQKRSGSASNRSAPLSETEEGTKKAAFLYEIAKSLYSYSDYENLLNTILEITSNSLSAERAVLFVLDKQNDQLWSHVGMGKHKQEIRFPKDTGIAGEVIKNGRSIHSENPYEHPSFDKSLDMKTGLKTRNLICVPIKNIKNEIIGAFQVLNKIDSGFDSDDISFFNDIASAVAIIIENTIFHYYLKKQEEEIKKLCDDFYVAQKQIVIDSKQAALGDVSYFINELRSRYSISAEVEKLKSKIKRNRRATEQIDKLHELHERFLEKITKHLAKSQKDLEKK